ncbi:MAG: alpha-amylase, partial [Salinibacterium sp.]|nr:alpha-amylase [Salinibacterium sp.]
GEELGLPEDVELPDSARQDPTWFRTNHERYGRDGCRVPIPWEALAPAFGFSSTGKSWLPQPPEWAGYARDAQEGQPDSTLELYKAALALRAKHGLGLGDVEWLSGYPEDVIAFRNGNVIVIANVGTQIVTIPPGVTALSSEPVSANLPGDTTVWLETSEA